MKFYIKYVTKLMVTEIYPTYSPMTTSLQKFITDVAETYSSREAIHLGAEFAHEESHIPAPS